MRGRPTRKHDLVTACYVLSEIEDASKRRRVVEALWQSTGNTLLIAEPGTPIGSSIIREARWQVTAIPSLKKGMKRMHWNFQGQWSCQIILVIQAEMLAAAVCEQQHILFEADKRQPRCHGNDTICLHNLVLCMYALALLCA